MNDEQYWEQRAPCYDSLKWAHDDGHLFAFLSTVEWEKKDYVLDLGIGTGIVARAIADRVDTVIGIDNSLSMIRQCMKLCGPKRNIFPMYKNAHEIDFSDGVFHKIIIRNVFHHIRGGHYEILRNCFRMLRPGGKILLGERVPPSVKTVDEYASMIGLKDDRLVFTPKTLKENLRHAGFRVLSSALYYINDFCVNDWLNGLDNLGQKTKREILFRHVAGSQEFKRACNFELKYGKCYVSIANSIIAGEKVG